MENLTTKIINIIKKAEKYEKFTSAPEHRNQVPSINYRFNRVLLSCPLNGCKIFKVYIDDIRVGEINWDDVYKELQDAKKRIETDLINSI